MRARNSAFAAPVSLPRFAPLAERFLLARFLVARFLRGLWAVPVCAYVERFLLLRFFRGRRVVAAAGVLRLRFLLDLRFLAFFLDFAALSRASASFSKLLMV